MSPQPRRSTKSDSPVAARAELDTSGPEGARDELLADQAKEQEKQQRAELRAGAKTPKGVATLETIPEQRSNRPGEKPLLARVDNMTRRQDSEPLEGHFVSIDLTNEDAKRGVEAVIGEGNARFESGDYGVYLEPASVGEDGYPVTVRVQLRDDHAAIVNVPFEALSPARAGRR